MLNPLNIPRWRFRWLLPLIALVLLTGASPVNRFERIMDKNPEKVVQKGDSWLQRNPDHEDHRTVQNLVMQADFLVANQTDSVRYWQEFQQKYDGIATRAMLREARKFEEAAAWRDALNAPDTVELWQQFRQEYPRGTHVPQARQREVQTAYDTAKTSQSVREWSQWRAEYAEWAAAESLISAAHAIEMQLAFDEIELSEEASDWEAWLEVYGDWNEEPALLQAASEAAFGFAEREAEEEGTIGAWRDLQTRYANRRGAGSLLRRARTEEIRLALSTAIDTESRSGMQDWADSYAADPEAEAFHEDAAGAFAPLLMTVPFDLEALDAFMVWAPQDTWNDPIEGHIAKGCLDLLMADPAGWEGPNWGGCGADLPSRPQVSAHSVQRLSALKRSAVRQGSLEALWRLSVLVGEETSQGRETRRHMAAQWWDAVENGDVSAEMFIARFPTDSLIPQAETRWFSLALEKQAENRWPRSNVSFVRTLSRNQTEIIFDVIDCKDRRIPGLPREAFTVVSGGEEFEIASFESLEADRPLKMMIGIDLSGSMQTEQQAVKMAVAEFTEIMRFRGRDIKVGLMGFTEELPAVHSPSSQPNDLIRWLGELPTAQAGGNGEDSAGAIAESARILSQQSGERAIVLLSDEPLQVHRRGRQLLNLQRTECDLMRSVGQCLQSCQTQDCLYRCFASGESYLGQAMSHCIQDNARYRDPKAYCIREATSVLNSDIQRCGNALDHPELPDLLQAWLNDRSVRPFFLVSDDRGSAFHQIANETGGRRLTVPSDSSSITPYRQALLDVADQLSKQYRIVINGQPGDNLVVGVQDAWHWLDRGESTSEADPIEVAEAVEAATWDGRPVVSQDILFEHPYPTRLRVNETNAVERQLGDGPWTEVFAATSASRALHAMDLGGPWPRTCTSDTDSVLCSDNGGRSWFASGTTGQVPTGNLSLSSDGALVALGGEREMELARIVTRDIPSSKLYFSVNSDEPMGSLTPFLTVIAERLAQNPDLFIRVEGHTDTTGETAYNEDLAGRRAAAVGAQLIAAGIAPERIDEVGFGERFPIRSGNSAAALARNRRVELVVLEPVQLGSQRECGPAPLVFAPTDTELNTETDAETDAEPTADTTPATLHDPPEANNRPRPNQRGQGISASMGDPIILGALDKSLIDAVIKRNMHRIRACYQRALTNNTGLNGNIVVKFVISDDGTIAKAMIKSSTMGSGEVENCIANQIRRLQFPEPRGGGTVVVTYPFAFSSAAG